MYLVPQHQGDFPCKNEGKLLSPRRSGIFPTASPWRHGEHDGLQRARPIQGSEGLDRDRCPGAGELRTSAGSYQSYSAGRWLGEKLAQADSEGHSDAFERPNGRRDLAVFHLGNQTGRKASLSGEGPHRYTEAEAELSDAFAHVHRAHRSLSFCVK